MTINKYAISDIHGCAKTFKALLEKINFSKEDELYLLGDYIDRGPNSKGVIDTIMDLETQGYHIKALKGNHEDMLLGEIKYNTWLKSHPATLKSFGVEKHNEIPQKYVDWMKNLHPYLEVDDYILVHAGLSFTSNNPFKDTYDMLWVRQWYDKIDSNWLGDRIIVHGHTPITTQKIKDSIHNLSNLPVINIDNGCYYSNPGEGKLCCLNLTTQSLIFQTNIDNDNG